MAILKKKQVAPTFEDRLVNNTVASSMAKNSILLMVESLEETNKELSNLSYDLLVKIAELQDMKSKAEKELFNNNVTVSNLKKLLNIEEKGGTL